MAANSDAARADHSRELVACAFSKISGNSPYLVINANSQGISAPPEPVRELPVPRRSARRAASVRAIANDNTVAPYGGDPVAAASSNAAPANYTWMTYETTSPSSWTAARRTPYRGHDDHRLALFVGVPGVSSAPTAAIDLQPDSDVQLE